MVDTVMHRRYFVLFRRICPFGTDNDKGGMGMDSAASLEAVIFDCDGVLVDTEPLHYAGYQEVLEPLGMGFDYKRYEEHYIGFDDRDAFRERYKELELPLDEATLLQLMTAKREAVRRIIARGVKSFPGVVPLVKSLAAAGIPLAVASGALREEITAFLDVLELGGVFPVVVAADEVKHSKPDPETYLMAMERLRMRPGLERLDPARCIAIEDTPAGIRSAGAAGLLVVGVTHTFPAQKITAAARVVESLDGMDPAGLAGLFGLVL